MSPQQLRRGHSGAAELLAHWTTPDGSGAAALAPAPVWLRQHSVMQHTWIRCFSCRFEEDLGVGSGLIALPCLLKSVLPAHTCKPHLEKTIVLCLHESFH